MRSSAFGFLTFICSLKGLSCSQWTMNVQPQVNGSLGQNVILSCIFTHPRQNTYTSIITVKWMLEKRNEPIFHCNLHNRTIGKNGNCTSRSSERFWLSGDPRKGDISLGIDNLQFSDAAQYTCRVELDYDKFKNYIDLNIYGPAQILALSLDLEPNGVILKCIAQGNPTPEVKWTSSRPLKNVFVKTFLRMVFSSVAFSEQDDYTCQAVNSLGRAQRTFSPSDHPNCSGLLVATGILGGLLALGLVVFILDVMRRRQSASGVLQLARCVPGIETSIYQANETVYANVTPGSVGCETRPVEVYSTKAPVNGEKVEVAPSVQNHIRPPKDRPPGPPSAPVKSKRF